MTVTEKLLIRAFLKFMIVTIFGQALLFFLHWPAIAIKWYLVPQKK